ncbi:hypothetical protein DH2020_037606 [Rehmannia glutinosa]|uniref:Uncharacterized protein n=1 Tax=Rehmannia glutinosa TaxID=99300 RepID=A0ABR0V0V8_REHGL
MATSSLHAAATLMQPTKVGRSNVQLRSAAVQSVGKAFGVEPAASGRLTCSLQADLKEFAQKCTEPLRLPRLLDLLLQPLHLSFRIPQKTNLRRNPEQNLLRKILPRAHLLHGQGRRRQQKRPPEFQNTKLTTRLTYTLDEIEGPFEVSQDGTVKFEEKDGIDYAAVTVQLPGGERVPFLFTIKQLVASGKPESFGGEFLVPSYRGSSFLDPKGRGVPPGMITRWHCPGGRGDEEELEKENNKNVASSTGKITLSVTKSKPETGEVIGVFESVQPSDTDLGSKAPKDVKIQGVWYAQLD